MSPTALPLLNTKDIAIVVAALQMLTNYRVSPETCQQ